MKNLVVLGLCSLLAIGCSSEQPLSKEDSIAPMLEQAKRDEGIKTNEVKSKDQSGKKADAEKPPGGESK